MNSGNDEWKDFEEAQKMSVIDGKAKKNKMKFAEIVMFIKNSHLYWNRDINNLLELRDRKLIL
jgi:hypothetical protein